MVAVLTILLDYSLFLVWLRNQNTKIKIDRKAFKERNNKVKKLRDNVFKNIYSLSSNLRYIIKTWFGFYCPSNIIGNFAYNDIYCSMYYISIETLLYPCVPDKNIVIFLYQYPYISIEIKPVDIYEV